MNKQSKFLSHAQVKAIATKYEAYLEVGASYAEALRRAAAQLRGTPCSPLLEALARVHANKYECRYTWDAGKAVFYVGEACTHESRNDAARMSWKRNVMVHFEPTKPAKPAKPAMPVTKARVSKAARDAAMDFLGTFEGKNLAEQIKQAIAVLNAM